MANSASSSKSTLYGPQSNQSRKKGPSGQGGNAAILTPSTRSGSSTTLALPLASGSLSSASLLRNKAARGDINSWADEVLRSSLARSASASPNVLTPPAPSPHVSPRLEGSDSARDPAGPALPRRLSLQPDAARNLKRQLQQDVERANAAAPRRDTARLYKEACSTDLLFLVDATCSMKPYLKSAKEQIRSIVTDIKSHFLNEPDVRIAVVAYRDHLSKPHIEHLDFTTSTDEVSMFLDTLKPVWGHDFAEDVLGGIAKALSLSWQQQTRSIVHIADAPPHGRELHDLASKSDDYPTPGSEPHGLTYKPLLAHMVELKINYALLNIKSYTDRMAFVFSAAFGNGNSTLLPTNSYYQEHIGTSSSSKTGKTGSSIAIEPQFEERRLGTTYAELRHLVVSTVTSSITRTSGRLSMTYNRSRSVGNRLSKDLTAIHEGIAELDAGTQAEAVLETSGPKWTTPGWLDSTLDMEGFCPAIEVHTADTLNDMMAADENIKLSVLELTVLARSKPFAEGASRIASYARTSASTSRFVVKSSKKHRGRAEAVEDMRIQALCKAFALEFNGLLDIEPPLDFVVSSCLQSKSRQSQRGRYECQSLEPFIEGHYIKYNSNQIWVNEDLPDDPFNQMAQAFSHFTFERSWGLLLVNDLQGVGHLLTDPSIQTRDLDRFKLSNTNLHDAGFKFFFTAHKCNDFCRKLELKSSGEMFLSGEFVFRETWPTMDPTVCCSNKLCRSIVRLNSAHQSPDFPGHNWCDACWSQLQGSVVLWVCVEEGPMHEYEVSRFFHESQGQLTPLHCPAHREKDTSGSSAAVVGGSMWNRMRSAGSTTTISGRAW